MRANTGVLHENVLALLLFILFYVLFLFFSPFEIGALCLFVYFTRMILKNLARTFSYYMSWCYLCNMKTPPQQNTLHSSISNFSFNVDPDFTSFKKVLKLFYLALQRDRSCVCLNFSFHQRILYPTTSLHSYFLTKRFYDVSFYTLWSKLNQFFSAKEKKKIW